MERRSHAAVHSSGRHPGSFLCYVHSVTKRHRCGAGVLYIQSNTLLFTGDGFIVGGISPKCFILFLENTTAWILPFTSGGFLYIALVNVVPDLLEESSLRYAHAFIM